LILLGLIVKHYLYKAWSNEMQVIASFNFWGIVNEGMNNLIQKCEYSRTPINVCSIGVTIIEVYWLGMRSVLWNIRPRFFFPTERWRSEVNVEDWGMIFHSTDRTSEVNNPYMYGWIEFWAYALSHQLNRLSSVSLTVYGRHTCSIKNCLLIWNFCLWILLKLEN
jgi:hypothetical protein